MTNDLRSFIRLLKEKSPDDVITVNKKEVDPRLEVTAILSKLERYNKYPLLYFEKVRGSNIPIVTNMCVGYKRLGITMGFEEAFRYENYFGYTDNLAEEYFRRKSSPIQPKKVEDGPVKEVIEKGENVDVTRLPVPVTSPEDDAPYITAGITVSKDLDKPEFPNFNLGIYRNRIIDKKKVGLYYSWGKHLHYLHKKAEDRNKPLEVAIVIGYHPAFYYAATDQSHLSEYSLAGSYMKEPVQLVKCETNDIYVPANAEIVIEGNLLPGVRSHEGPFGEYPGYYGQEVDAPVIQIDCITRRRDPIYYYAPSGRHAEHLSGGLGHVMDAGHMLRKYFPTVKKVHRPWQLSYYVFIQMKKLNEGDPINVGMMAVGMNQFFKYAVVVDEDVDIFDDREVMWAMATRARPDEDFVVIPNAKGNRLDPTTYVRLRNARDSIVTKLVVDATTKTGLPYKIPKVIKEPLVDNLDLSKFGIE